VGTPPITNTNFPCIAGPIFWLVNFNVLSLSASTVNFDLKSIVALSTPILKLVLAKFNLSTFIELTMLGLKIIRPSNFAVIPSLIESSVFAKMYSI